MYYIPTYYTRSLRMFNRSNAIRNGNVQITLRASTQYTRIAFV